MQIETPTKRRPQESIVPMINVVFLLLIFFLMTSQIAPPDPVEVETPSSASGADPEAETKLYLDAQGMLFFRDASGDLAFSAVQQHMTGAERLLLSADKNVEAAKLAATLRRLAGMGAPRVELVVSPQ
jgi:biopolymer transport protein ExbD